MSSHDELLDTVGGTRAKAIKKFRWACGGCVFFCVATITLASLLIFISIERTKEQDNALSDQAAKYDQQIKVLQNELADMRKAEANRQRIEYAERKVSLQDIPVDYFMLSVRNGNTIPSMRSLDLSSCQLDRLSNNNISNMTSLNLTNCFHLLKNLENNAFPSLSQLLMDNKTSLLETFSGNTLGSLTKGLTLDTPNLKQFNNNVFSAPSLSIKQASSVNFINNTLNGVRKLDIDKTVMMKEVSGNKLPNMQEPTKWYNEAITAFYGNEMPLLKQFVSDSPELSKFTNNTLNNLVNLTLMNGLFNSVTTEDGNVFPILRRLSIIKCPIGKFDLGSMSQLEYLQIGGGQTLVDRIDLNDQLYPSLKEVWLYFNNITKFDDVTLSLLTILDVSNNQVETFNNNHLQSLRTLNLNNNKLQQIDTKTLPNLETLKLANNQIYLFSGISMIHLKYLNIESNQLQSFQNNTLTAIEQLILRGNQIEVFSCQGMTKLQNLYLNDNKLTDTVIDQILSCGIVDLKLLTLGGNNIADTDSARQRFMEKYPNLILSI